MSVVGPDFDTLKRYNIDQLRQPRASASSEAKDEEAKEAVASREEA